MKKYKTNKLFYDKYLYKLEVFNTLGPIFRGKNFPYARDILDKIQQSYEHDGSLTYTIGMLTRNVSHTHFKEAKFLLYEFQKQNKFTLRIEGSSLNIYSNDLDWINLLASINSNAFAIWIPENINIQPNVIITSEQKPYEYKVTLGPKVDTSFANWATANPDKVFLGKTLHSYIKEDQYTQGMYFYVRDERVLHLVSIMIGDSVKRIDKIVCSKNIDK